MRSMTKSDYVDIILFTPQPAFEDNIPRYWEKIKAALQALYGVPVKFLGPDSARATSRSLGKVDTQIQSAKERPAESETV